MIGVLTGGVMVGSQAFLTGCKETGKSEAGFTPAKIALLNEVGETILPKTSSPGAKEAQVGEFMEIYVKDCYTQAEQDQFMNGLDELESAFKKKYDKSFVEATPEQRKEFVGMLETESKEYNLKRDERDKPQKDQAEKEKREFVRSPSHYYSMIKQLTLFSFFTSKPGMTQALRHEPLPQRYDGAFPYKKGDKAWAE